jgi:RNA ligase (TIGR02306 family)
MRKLASVQRISDIQPIEGADKIVRATINGWHLVTAVDNGFNVGDLVVYFEVDSWIPTEIAPFLSKGKEPREFEGVRGERLRTIKLRGTTSQGLILPLSSLGEIKEIDGKMLLRINNIIQ